MPVLAKPSEEPISASPVDVEVVLLGPGVSGAYTPESALASAEQIRRAAEEAIRQRSGDPAKKGLHRNG